MARLRNDDSARAKQIILDVYVRGRGDLNTVLEAAAAELKQSASIAPG